MLVLSDTEFKNNYMLSALVEEIDNMQEQRGKNREPQLLSPRVATTEACMPRVLSLQQEKPPQ